MKARQGDIENFTGISAIYECPENPDIVIESDNEDTVSAANRIIAMIGDLFNLSSGQFMK